MRKQIKSNWLNTMFSVSCYNGEKYGKGYLVIRHESMEDILFNQLPEFMRNHNLKFDYDISLLCYNGERVAFQCTISDSVGRKVIELGESCTGEAKDQFAHNNLLTTAKNRAIDHALIKYLNIPAITEDGRVLSDAANLVGINIQYDNNSKNVNFQNEHSDLIKKWGTFILNFGQYRGQPLLSVYNNPDGRRWLISTLQHAEAGNMDSQKGQLQIDYIRSFLKDAGLYK